MFTCIVWFRQDLRLSDNPAWRHACFNADRVLPVFIHGPEEEGDWPAGAASRWWLHHSLAELGNSLQAKGTRLVLLKGPAWERLWALAQRCEAEAVVWNRRYEPAALRRDRAVEKRLREAGLTVQSFNSALLREPWQVSTKAGEPYRVFTPFWRTCRDALEDAVPERAPPKVPSLPEASPEGGSLQSLGLLPRVRWDEGLEATWQPGERGAHRALRRFCDSRLENYASDRDRPDRDGTSGLSPHLHFGELSPRQVVAAVRRALGASSVGGLADSAERFLSELGWRDFAHHLLFHFPNTPDDPLDPRFRRFPWAKRYDDRLSAWQRGRTGIPIVDAGMRQLWRTGWMHNRVRMLAASLLTKNLRIPWQEGARWFWDTLVDADLANNTLGWQWTAGCGADAAPFFRIFNPVLQGERFDPDGRYVRKWVPELAGLDAALVHAPWRADKPPRDYPDPVVDLKGSREEALKAFDAIKQST